MVKSTKQSYFNHLAAFIGGPLLKLIEACFDLLIPLFAKAIIDLSQYKTIEAIPNENIISIALGKFIRSFGTWINAEQVYNDCLIGLVIILVMGVLGFLVTMITQYIAARTAMKVGTELRSSLFKKILTFSKEDKDKITTSKLLTVTNSDTYSVQQGVLFFIRLIVRAPFIILGSLIISFILNWKIGFVFLVIVPLILLIIFVFMHKASKRYVKIQEQLDDISEVTGDTYNGIKAIKAFGKEDFENKKFQSKSGEYHKRSVNVNKLNSFVNPLTFAVVSIATVIVILIIGQNVLNKDQQTAISIVSTALAEVNYLSQIFITLILLTNVILVLTKAKVSSKRIDEVLAVEPSIVNLSNAQTRLIDEGQEFISFKDVSYSYAKNDQYSISDISFSLNKGETLGIIGGVGSGKSTIINLIERFNDVSKGEIKYKGINIKNYDLPSLRKEIGLVPQKSILLKGTIKSNLCMGNVYSESNIDNALKASEAYEYVSKFEDSIEHSVEEGGTNLSGGQRQRLCIARALIKNPELLILDDSTSALDFITESKVKSNIDKQYKNLTKIIISQRVSSIMNADKILVLDEGKLIACGTHDELLKSCSLYGEIYKTQVNKGAL